MKSKKIWVGIAAIILIVLCMSVVFLLHRVIQIIIRKLTIVGLQKLPRMAQ